MAIDPRKRQKKLEKRKSKQKEKKKALARVKPDSTAALIKRAGSAPVLHCCVTDTIWDEGMGQALISRELPDGRIAYAIFLVDVYCLGVKDALCHVSVRTRYDSDVYDRLFNRYTMVKLSPACMRKLVEGAVEYARNLGLPPHADYQAAHVIFGDIDASQCDREFTYGKDGKPLFIAGPYDRLEKRRRILATLTESVGADGFHYLLPMTGGLPPGSQIIEPAGLEREEEDEAD